MDSNIPTTTAAYRLSCERCRGKKLRCIWPAEQTDGSCNRCLRAGVECERKVTRKLDLQESDDYFLSPQQAHQDWQQQTIDGDSQPVTPGQSSTGPIFTPALHIDHELNDSSIIRVPDDLGEFTEASQAAICNQVTTPNPLLPTSSSSDMMISEQEMAMGSKLMLNSPLVVFREPSFHNRCRPHHQHNHSAKSIDLDQLGRESIYGGLGNLSHSMGDAFTDSMNASTTKSYGQPFSISSMYLDSTSSSGTLISHATQPFKHNDEWRSRLPELSTELFNLLPPSGLPYPTSPRSEQGLALTSKVVVHMKTLHELARLAEKECKLAADRLGSGRQRSTDVHLSKDKASWLLFLSCYVRVVQIARHALASVYWALRSGQELSVNLRSDKLMTENEPHLDILLLLQTLGYRINAVAAILGLAQRH
ncbi:hypothetical protein PWT90_00501 [Aphanocladium album]|nr:hypothetical protein PWT90_00501 [Aphanocladium album]